MPALSGDAALRSELNSYSLPPSQILRIGPPVGSGFAFSRSTTGIRDALRVSMVTSRYSFCLNGSLKVSNRESVLGLAWNSARRRRRRETSLTAANDLVVRRALESTGVEFIDENGGGPGVRLRKRLQKRG